MASLYGIKVLRPSYTSATSCLEPIETLDTPEVKKAACSAYVTDTDVSTEVQPSNYLTKVPSGIMAFTCPEEPCRVFHNTGYYFATVEQWVAHWNTFHVAISPKINCPETGCPCKIPAAPDSVDGFLRHLTRAHGYLQQDGKWPRLNDIVRRAIDIGPNPYCWPPREEHGSHLRPSEVNNLTSTDMKECYPSSDMKELDMKEPFLASRWVARTRFDELVRAERPAARKSSQPKGGKKRQDPSTAKPSSTKAKSSKEELRMLEDSWGPLTVESIVNRSGNSGGRGSLRGRSRGRGRSPASSATPSTAGTSREGSDRSRKPTRGTPFPVAIKSARGHKRHRSRSGSSCPGESRSKRHSGQDSTEEKQPSRKPASSWPSNPGPKPSGGGSAFNRKFPKESATLLCGHRQGEGPVPVSAIPVETYDGHIVYEGTEDEPILKYEDCLAESQSMDQELRLWTIEHITAEPNGMRDSTVPGKGIWSPHRDKLPNRAHLTGGTIGADLGRTWMRLTDKKLFL